MHTPFYGPRPGIWRPAACWHRHHTRKGPGRYISATILKQRTTILAHFPCPPAASQAAGNLGCSPFTLHLRWNPLGSDFEVETVDPQGCAINELTMAPYTNQTCMPVPGTHKGDCIGVTCIYEELDVTIPKARFITRISNYLVCRDQPAVAGLP